MSAELGVTVLLHLVLTVVQARRRFKVENIKFQTLFDCIDTVQDVLEQLEQVQADIDFEEKLPKRTLDNLQLCLHDIASFLNKRVTKGQRDPSKLILPQKFAFGDHNQMMAEAWIERLTSALNNLTTVFDIQEKLAKLTVSNSSKTLPLLAKVSGKENCEAVAGEAPNSPVISASCWSPAVLGATATLTNSQAPSSMTNNVGSVANSNNCCSSSELLYAAQASSHNQNCSPPHNFASEYASLQQSPVLASCLSMTGFDQRLAAAATQQQQYMQSAAFTRGDLQPFLCIDVESVILDRFDICIQIKTDWRKSSDGELKADKAWSSMKDKSIYTAETKRVAHETLQRWQARTHRLAGRLDDNVLLLTELLRRFMLLDTVHAVDPSLQPPQVGAILPWKPLALKQLRTAVVAKIAQAKAQLHSLQSAQAQQVRELCEASNANALEQLQLLAPPEQDSDAEDDNPNDNI